MQLSKEDLKSLLSSNLGLESIEEPVCKGGKITFKWDVETYNQLIAFFMAKANLRENNISIMDMKGVLTRTFYSSPNQIEMKAARDQKVLEIEFTNEKILKKISDIVHSRSKPSNSLAV